MAEKNKKKRTFFTDIWRKILALLLGIVAFWMLSKPMAEQIILEQVPVTIEIDEQQGIYLPFEETKIQIGYRSFLGRTKYGPEDFHLKVDLRGLKKSQHAFRHVVVLTQEFVDKQPSFTEVDSFKPQSLVLDLDSETELSVPVKVMTTGSLEQGKTAQFLVEPSHVRLSGPSLVLRGISQVETMELPLSWDMADGKPQNIDLKPCDSSVVMEPQSVQVTVWIQNEGQIGTRELDGVPVQILSKSQSTLGLKAFPATEVKLKLQGRQKTVNAVERQHLLAYIEISGASVPGAYKAPVKVLGLPAKVTATVEPEFVEVELEEITGEKPAEPVVAPEAVPAAAPAEK